MKTITAPIQKGLLQYDISLLGKPEDLLFVDIETTGFAARSSCLYLIGCITFDNGSPVLTQYFGESPSDEDKILSAFLSLCREKRVLLHYNGNNFDIPYLRQKCASFGYSEPFSEMNGIDIYKRVMPYKRALGVENLKQKTMEQFLGISREDEYNGGELINVYREYVAKNALLKKQKANDHVDESLAKETEEKEKLLLLHNADDMRGMLSLLSLLAYADLFLRPLTIMNISVKKVTEPTGRVLLSLVIRLNFETALPKELVISKKGCRFVAKEKEGTLSIPLYCGSLKYFYGNYKDYYYLPDEDTALHKSVASYVSPDHRVQATAATCYTKKEGRFLPQWDILFEPLFKTSYEDSINYFELTDDLKASPEEFRRYAYHIIDFLLHEKCRA